jgi:hypothetical protein
MVDLSVQLIVLMNYNLILVQCGGLTAISRQAL